MQRRYDIEPLSLDTILNQESFYGKSCKKCASKTSPRIFFLISVNDPEQPLHERKPFENKIFWKRVIKKP